VVAAAAAFAERPPGHGVVVADAGTAITVDAVDAEGTFLGGLILPGLRLGLTALGSDTSLLPQVTLDPEAPLLGRSTPTCLQAGALHGGAALLDGLFERIAGLLGTPTTGFLTGGDGPLLARRTSRFARHDPGLVLRGLRLAYLRRTGRPPANPIDATGASSIIDTNSPAHAPVPAGR
jgi:type III pantothenate kinase